MLLLYIMHILVLLHFGLMEYFSFSHVGGQKMGKIIKYQAHNYNVMQENTIGAPIFLFGSHLKVTKYQAHNLLDDACQCSYASLQQ